MVSHLACLNFIILPVHKSYAVDEHKKYKRIRYEMDHDIQRLIL